MASTELVQALKTELERLRSEKPPGWREQCIRLKQDIDEEEFDLLVCDDSLPKPK